MVAVRLMASTPVAVVGVPAIEAMLGDLANHGPLLLRQAAREALDGPGNPGQGPRPTGGR